ncbi:MAG: hypothetical protein G01um101448_440 [Parcubacteria group bacterium Gr01-1014_48]|nr:MAG: hypothetical protein Greene041614_416 [Parcubacteria group bacterium Greene0416_14]TSC73947.1 MAG: hypothetical protein G01um101448_440 [Parcubacteria group bacterium Gr01-1014_48]TSD00936.1 MAG: hypothetical protein Greene101415_586 [Parcubacteria group bacterium Greene1014_15]TSD07888.1 MAG: hypothetical protein Greene07144_614 [Parcubacteria group bacterium Greene0714_4]
MIHIIRTKYRYYICSWSAGVISITPPRRRYITEDDVLARALWLERNGKKEDAEEVLDAYIVSLRETRSAMWRL